MYSFRILLWIESAMQSILPVSQIDNPNVHEAGRRLVCCCGACECCSRTLAVYVYSAGGAIVRHASTAILHECLKKASVYLTKLFAFSYVGRDRESSSLQMSIKLAGFYCCS